MSYPPVQLRPMGIGDLLDEAIRLYRRHFLRLVAIAALVVMPLSVIGFVVSLAATVPLLSMDTGYAYADPQYQLDAYLSVLGKFCGLQLIYLVFSTIASTVMYGAMVCAVSEACFGRRLSAGAAYAWALGRFWALLAVTIISTLVLVLLSITVVGIPFAIYLGIGWSLMWQTLLLERMGVGGALGRSRALVRGFWWRTVGILILLGLLGMVIYAIFYVPVAILGVLGGLPGSPGYTMANAAGTLIGALGEAVGIPISTCGIVLLYYDLRARKEGLDLEMQVQQADVAPGMGPVPQ